MLCERHVLLTHEEADHPAILSRLKYLGFDTTQEIHRNDRWDLGPDFVQFSQERDDAT